MTNFYWQIVSMLSYTDIDGLSDVVFQVNWSCNAVEGSPDALGSLAASSVGSVPVTYVAGSPYTPYDQLTQEQVWGWVNPQIDRTEIEANFQAMIDEQKNPKVVTPPLPWPYGYLKSPYEIEARTKAGY
jgi:hypothetical protein